MELFKKRILERLVVVGSLTGILLLAGTGFSATNVAKENHPEAHVVSLDVSPKVANAGIPVTIVVGVENPHSESVEYSIPVTVQGAEEEMISGVLSSGSSRRHLVSTIQTNPDLYSVSARGFTNTFTISIEKFSAEILSVFPSIVDPGSTTLVQGVITNDGGISGVHNSTVFLDGFPIKELTGILLPGESHPFSFEIQIEKPGVHVISVWNASVSFLSLSPLIETRIPELVPISKQRTVALDLNGEQIFLTGDDIKLNHRNGNLWTVELPFQLSSGNSLVSISDIATGISYQNNELAIPLPNEKGTGEISLRLLLNSFSVSGNRLIGHIETIWIEFSDISVNLEIIEQGLGTIDFKGKIVPEFLPVSSSIQIKVSKTLESLLRENLNQALLDSGSQIGALALGFDVVTKESGKPLNLKSGSLQFSIGSSWIETFSEDSSAHLVLVNNYFPEITGAERIQYDAQNRLVFGTTFNSSPASFRIVTLMPKASSQKKIVESTRFEPSAVVPGNAIEIIGKLIQEDNGKGIIPVSLYKDREIVRTKIVSFDEDLPETVRFVMEIKDEGMYSIGLNGTSAELSVASPLEPNNVLVTAITSSATSLPAGSPLSISITVFNRGNKTGLALPILKMNESPVRAMPAVLEPGESREIKTTMVLSEPGPYRFDIGKLGISVNVSHNLPENVFVIEELSIHPRVLDPGEAAVLQMELTNNDYVESVFSGQGTIGNNKISVGPISVPALTTIVVRKEFIVFESGIQKGNLNGHAFQIEIRTAKETNFEVSNFLVSPTHAKKDQLILITATLSNSLPVLGKDEITLKVDGMIVSSEWAWLGPGESKDVEFEISESELGSHSVSVNGADFTFKIERIIPLVILIPLGIFGFLGGIVGVYYGRRNWSRIKLLFQKRKRLAND